jgi:hypothetical protein
MGAYRACGKGLKPQPHGPKQPIRNILLRLKYEHERRFRIGFYSGGLPPVSLGRAYTVRPGR